VKLARLLPLAALAVAGCETTPLAPPQLSPVGTGLAVNRLALPVTVPTQPQGIGGSLYGRRTRDLLTDVRAGDVGDTMTVLINIDDKAKFDNESERKRTSSIDSKFNIFANGQGFDGPGGSGNLDVGAKTGTASNYKGSGAIDRSEKLSLQVAAVVTEVLENGNLVISGSQEIRVNDEIRVLQVTGVVNPLDVTRENTVPYEKIAEARISYGGRGRHSEIQSPGWGQQIYDRVVPF
jgi:flagellar L-ring protein FlgH